MSIMQNLRRHVLQSYKKLHRTRLQVFEGDEKALTAARSKINEEFQKNKNVTEVQSIEAMIQYAEDVERELRTQVIQIRQVKPDVYEAKIRSDITKLENIPYNDAAIPEGGIKGKSRCQPKKD